MSDQTAMQIGDRQILPAAVADEAARIGQMLQLAVERGVTPEALEKLVDLHERISARMAAAEFSRAFAEFKRRCPKIEKTRSSQATGQSSGARFAFKYANIEDVAEAVDPILTELGFSYSFSSDMDGQNVKVTCRLRHVAGHVEEATDSQPLGSSLPVSDQQKRISATTYGKRQALIGVLGLVTVDEDAEGANREAITEEQAATLDALLDELKGKVDRHRFLAWAGASAVAEIPAAKFAAAVSMLERRRFG